MCNKPIIVWDGMDLIILAVSGVILAVCGIAFLIMTLKRNKHDK